MPTADRNYTHICPKCWSQTVRVYDGKAWSCFNCGASGAMTDKEPPTPIEPESHLA